MVQSDDNRQSQAEKPAPPVAVVGAGSIGTGFTAVFAMAGRRVKVYDPSGEKRQAVRPRIAEIIRDLREFELTGQDEDAVLANVLVVDELTDALDDVEHVQECGPEQLGLKRELFAELVDDRDRNDFDHVRSRQNAVRERPDRGGVQVQVLWGTEETRLAMKLELKVVHG